MSPTSRCGTQSLERASPATLRCRTVARIQEKTTKKGGRNLLSRLAHAKNDKDTITTWKSDLNRILHIFNVSFVIPARSLLNVRLQAELALNTNVIVSDVHHGVVNTHVMVSDIHRNILKGQDEQHRSVSGICAPFHRWMNMNRPPPLYRLKPGQRSQLPMDPVSYICI